MSDVRIQIENWERAHREAIENPLIRLFIEECARRSQSCKERCADPGLSNDEIRNQQGQSFAYQGIGNTIMYCYQTRLASLREQLGKEELKNAESQGYISTGDALHGGTTGL